MADLSELLHLGDQPISAEAPAGASVRYEPEFEQLSGEIEKLESVSSPEVDWDLVVAKASAILSGKSKDLLVAAYLSRGLYQQHSFAGLAAGLGICRALVAEFWEDLFPEKKRLRARAAALQWIGDRLEGPVRDGAEPGAGEREALSAALAALGELVAGLGERFGEDAPDLGGLRRSLADKLATLEEEAEPAAAEPAAVAAAARPQSGTPEGARAALEQIWSEVVAAAATLRGADPSDPLPYRLVRFAAWNGYAQAPPPGEGGRTGLRGGDAGMLERFEQQLGEDGAPQVIEAAETHLVNVPFWIDLNYYVHRALEQLGHGDAARTVARETSAFVARLEGLEELSFADGLALVSPRTRLWLEGLAPVGAAPRESGGAPAGEGGEGDEERERILAEARKLALGGDARGAIALCLEALAGSRAACEQFRWRLDLARLCLDAGQGEVAAAQLGRLEEECQRFGLEEWDPALAVEVIQLLLRCPPAAAAGSGAAQRRAELFTRLCRLDPCAALAFKDH